MGMPAVASDWAGLWIGDVRVYKASPLGGAPRDLATLTSEFSFRLILHVDDAGSARLLQEVVLVSVPEETADGVVFTDRVFGSAEAALALLEEDRKARARRLTAPAFAFDGATLALDGQAGPGGSVTGAIALAPGHPLNPYRHEHHPDHDGLDETMAPLADPTAEVPAIARQIEIAWSDKSDLTARPPQLKGAWFETIAGPAARPIGLGGSVTLERASTAPGLE